MNNDIRLTYKPFPTLFKFHCCASFVRGILGPFGSGKSVGCVEELQYIAMRQPPAGDGVRYTRFGVIRATYPNLRTTTKKTLEEWLPASCGSIKETAPMEGRYRIPLPDGTTVNMELLLIAVEDETQVKKLRSTNFTAIWINEATEVPGEVLGACIERVGRYPSGQLGRCKWSGIIMDYNKPPKGHWLHSLMETEARPQDYDLFVQPPAAFKTETEEGLVLYDVNPDAENLDNLAGGVLYYSRMIDNARARDKLEEIDQMLCLLDVYAKDGKPVWPSFNRDFHVAKVPLQPVEGADTIIAIDTSGVHPALLIAQFQNQNWCVLDELYGDGEGFEPFLDEALIPLLTTKYYGCKFLAVCDPANARDGRTATTPTQVLQSKGIRAVVADTNQTKPRIEGVSLLLNRHNGGILISPTCELLIAACAGGYKYKKRKIAGSIDVVYSSEPEKNNHSHPADALQYLARHVLHGEGNEQSDAGVRDVMRRRSANRKRVM